MRTGPSGRERERPAADHSLRSTPAHPPSARTPPHKTPTTCAVSVHLPASVSPPHLRTDAKAAGWANPDPTPTPTGPEGEVRNHPAGKTVKTKA